jgi:hypothetical protein
MATRGEQDPYDKSPVVLLRATQGRCLTPEAGVSHPRLVSTAMYGHVLVVRPCTAMYLLYGHVRPCTCCTAMYGHVRLLVVPLLWEAGHVKVHDHRTNVDFLSWYRCLEAQSIERDFDPTQFALTVN